MVETKVMYENSLHPETVPMFYGTTEENARDYIAKVERESAGDVKSWWWMTISTIETDVGTIPEMVAIFDWNGKQIDYEPLDGYDNAWYTVVRYHPVGCWNGEWKLENQTGDSLREWLEITEFKNGRAKVLGGDTKKLEELTGEKIDLSQYDYFIEESVYY